MTPLTRLGIQITATDYDGWGATPFEHASDVAAVAESSGFDSVWVSGATNGLVGASMSGPFVGGTAGAPFEAYTVLGGLSARTSTVRLGALTSAVNERPPALLAKTVTGLDVLSGGRAVLGIGVATERDEPATASRDKPPDERLGRLEETLLVCRVMFTDPEPTFEGRYFRIEAAVNRPPPVRSGGPPILVDGKGGDGARRVAARHADACTLFGDADSLRDQIGALARHCEQAGRDPAELDKIRVGVLVVAKDDAGAARELRELRRHRHLDDESVRSLVTAGGPETVVGQVGRLLDAGLDGVVFNIPGAADVERVALAGETLTRAFGR